MAKTVLGKNNGFPAEPALVTVDGRTVFGSGVAGDPIRAAGAGGEVVTDGSLTGNGTSGNPLGTVAGETAIVVTQAGGANGVSGNGTTGNPLHIGNPTIAAARVTLSGGAITGLVNFGFASVVRLTLGVYQLVLSAPPSSENFVAPMAISTPTAGPTAVMSVVLFSASKFNVNSLDFAGNPVDSSFFVTVTLMGGTP